MSHAHRPTFWIVLCLLVAPLGFGGCDGDGEAESAGKEWQLSLEPRLRSGGGEAAQADQARHALERR